MLKKVIIKREGPQPQTQTRCIGCGTHLSAGMHYTGSVIEGTSFKSQETVKHLPVLGIMECMDKSYVLGGQEYTETKRIPFMRRKKGPLCDGCASSIETIEVRHKDGTSYRELIVKTDPRPGFIGTTLLPSYERISSSPAPEEKQLPQVVSRNLTDNQWLNVGRKK
jgi:hypothetical protein